MSVEDFYRKEEAGRFAAELADYNRMADEIKALIPRAVVHVNQNPPRSGGWFVRDGVKHIGWDVFDPYAKQSMFFLSDGTVVTGWTFDYANMHGPWSYEYPKVVTQVLVVERAHSPEILRSAESYDARTTRSDLERLHKWLKELLAVKPPPAPSPPRPWWQFWAEW